MPTIYVIWDIVNNCSFDVKNTKEGADNLCRTLNNDYYEDKYVVRVFEEVQNEFQ